MQLNPVSQNVQSLEISNSISKFAFTEFGCSSIFKLQQNETPSKSSSECASGQCTFRSFCDKIAKFFQNFWIYIKENVLCCFFTRTEHSSQTSETSKSEITQSLDKGSTTEETALETESDAE